MTERIRPALALAALALAALAACNTVQGVGKDVSAGGDAISDTARQTQKAISN